MVVFVVVKKHDKTLKNPWGKNQGFFYILKIL